DRPDRRAAAVHRAERAHGAGARPRVPPARLALPARRGLRRLPRHRLREPAHARQCARIPGNRAVPGARGAGAAAGGRLRSRGGVMHVDQTLTLIEKTVFLKTMPEAESIPTEALAEIAARAEEIHLDPGDVLYHEGDPDRGFFVVIDGSLELRKGRAMVRVVTSGMAIGELWRGVDEPHQYTLTATEQSHV